MATRERRLAQKVRALSRVEDRRMQLLAEMKLRFDWNMAQTGSGRTPEGKYIGSGRGIVHGSDIDGTVEWDLFEIRETAFCRSNLVGIVTTNDGARVGFSSRGFMRKVEGEVPERWTATASVLFETTDSRYVWMNALAAVWEGMFYLETFEHTYKVYVQGESARRPTC